MEEMHSEYQNETEQAAYQMVREEPLKQVETFDNKSITKLEKARKKKSRIPIAVAIITIFFLVLVFVFFKLYPKYALIKSLDTWSDSFGMVGKVSPYSKQYNWDEMTTKGTATMKIGDFLLSNFVGQDTENLDILKKLNSLSFQLETRIDKKNHKSFVDMIGTLENEKFFDIGYMTDNEKQYVLLKEVFDTYLQLEENEEVVTPRIDPETFSRDLEYTWGVLKKSLKKNIKSSYIKTHSEKIEVDGKMVRTTKISFMIDEKTGYELSTKIIKDLKADKRTYDFLVNLYPEFANYEVTKSDESYEMCYSVNVAKGIPRIVRASLEINENDFIRLTKGEDSVIEFGESGEILFRIIMREEKNGFKMKLQFTENDLEMILTGRKEGKASTYNLSMEASGTTLEIISTHTLKEEKSDLIAENIQLSFQVKTGGLSLDIMNINLDFETTKGAMFEEIKNSKLITDLTEEEQQKIQSYFENIFDM